MAWLRLQPADHERQPAGGNRDEHLGVAVARDVPAHGEPRHRDDGVADAADAVGQAVIVHAALARIERRMDVDHRAGVVGGLPERIEIRGIEHAADAARQGRDHRAAESPPPSPPSARRRRSRRPASAMSPAARSAARPARRHSRRLIDERAPGLAVGRRQVAAEPVGPAAVHLLVDALLVHPGETARDIAQALHDRPASAWRCRTRSPAPPDPRSAAARESRGPLLADGGQNVRRDQMAVGIDDHRFSASAF